MVSCDTCITVPVGSRRRSHPAICSGDQHSSSLSSTMARNPAAKPPEIPSPPAHHAPPPPPRPPLPPRPRPPRPPTLIDLGRRQRRPHHQPPPHPSARNEDHEVL